MISNFENKVGSVCVFDLKVLLENSSIVLLVSFVEVKVD